MDYNEILLQAIDTVVETRLQGLQYDKTVKAQIVEDLGNGAYTVSENSSVKYEATVSSDTSYSVNDYVHVLIPSGDYANPKVIVGKYTEDNASSPVVYLRPLDSFIAMAEEMQMLEEGAGIQASASGGPTTVELGTISLAASASSAQKYNSSYSALGISCNFKALFNGYDMVSGNYGLRFYLLQDNGQVAVAEMDSSSWFGNPYGYYSYGNQTFVFDISNIKNIQTITVVLYQKANFYYLDANNKRIGFETEYANIFAKDLVIQLGQDITDIADNTFTIAAVDGQENYSEGQTAKEIIATWYNKDEDNRYIGFSDGIVDIEYDEDVYADKLEEEYLGGFEAYSDIAPLRESYGYHKTLLKISSLYDNLEEILTNLYNNVVKKAADFLGDADKEISDFYDNKLEPYQKKLAEIISSNETYFNNREKAMTADYKVVAEGGTDITEYSFVITGVPSSSSMWSALQTALVAAGEKTQQVAYFELLNRKRAEYKALYDEITFELGGNLNRPDYVSLHSKLMNFYRDFYSKLSSKNLISFEEEYAAFVEDYKNRYCIYWYRVNLEATDRWLGDGWERIVGDTYPDVAENGETYLKYNRPMSTVDIDADLDEMKFKAILFYNHDMFESNILTLDNLDIPSEPSADISSALRIEHGTNSQDFYQKYGSNYVLLKYSDSMTNRQIKVQYNGLEEGNEALDGNIIYWYVPQINSMLEVWENNLLEKGFSSLAATIAANSEALEANEEYSPGEDLERILRHERTGYACYYKVITSHENEEDISFYYQIAKVYNPMHTNNIVYCVLDRDGFDYEGQISFSFATYGTAGTDYTLAVVPTGRQAAIEQYDNKIHPLQVIGSFTGYNGATVEDTPDLDFKLAAGDESAIEINALSSNGKTYCTIGLETIMDSPKNFVESNSLYNILKVSTNYKDININMATYLPVAISFGKYYLKGTSIVSYDNFGSILNTSNIESYELYDRETNELVEDVVFTIQYYKSSSPWSRVSNLSTAAKVGAPELKIRTDPETSETTYTLSPTTMYITGALNVVVVAWKDDEPLFAQPIYVYKDQWGSSLLNGWDGNLVIDEKNNYILSAMMGAGYKDTDNTFNGVLMGDISVANLSGVGLYGFNKGTASFGLDYRGTAFFGKSGSGQIIFDGNNGTIISGNYSINDNTGMMIDLEEGHIDAYNFRLTSNRILIDSSESASTYFRIYDEDKNVLIYIGPKSYYLQSSNYANDEDGMKIDLANGHIDAYNFRLNAMKSGVGIFVSGGEDESTVFKVAADDNNKIIFENGTLSIATKKIIINAWNEAAKSGFYLDSENATFKLGSGDSNKILFDKSNGLSIVTNNIIISTGWNDEAKTGFELNTQTTSFKIGSSTANYFQFADGGLSFATNKEIQIDCNSNSEDKYGFWLHTVPPSTSWPKGAVSFLMGDWSGASYIKFDAANDSSLEIKSSKLLISAFANGVGVALDSTEPSFFIGDETVHGDGNTRNDDWFKALLKSKEKPNFFEYKNGVATIGGSIYAYQGIIGPLSIYQDRLEVENEGEEITVTEYIYSSCSRPEWANTKNIGAQVTASLEFTETEQVISVTKIGANMEFISGDFERGLITFSVTNFETSTYASGYISNAKVTYIITNSRTGGDDWVVNSRLKISKTYSTKGITTITPYGINIQAFGGTSSADIQGQLNNMKKGLGMGASGASGDNNVFTKIEFRVMDSSGNEIEYSDISRPKIEGYYYNRASLADSKQPKAASIYVDGLYINGDIVLANDKYIYINGSGTIYNGVHYTEALCPWLNLKNGKINGSGSSYSAIGGLTEKVFIDPNTRTLYNEGSSLELVLGNSSLYLQNSNKEKLFNINATDGLSDLLIDRNGILLKTSASWQVPFGIGYNNSKGYAYLTTTYLLVSNTLATPTFWVGTIKDTSGATELMSLTSSGITIPSAVTFSGSVNGNEKGFGKLAFADSVKKNFDISVSGDVTLEVDVSEYYTADKDYYYNYDYSIEHDGGSGTVTFTHDASKDGQTETYTYNYDIYHGYSTKVYYTKATTKSVTKNVTLKGNTDLELEPSDTDTGTETIEITGTQQ